MRGWCPCKPESGTVTMVKSLFHFYLLPPPRGSVPFTSHCGDFREALTLNFLAREVGGFGRWLTFLSRALEIDLASISPTLILG